MPHFLFPSDPLDPRTIDDFFGPQRDALVAAGHTSSLVREAVLEGRGRLQGIPSQSLVVYRGWMVTGDQYANLHAAITGADGAPLTSPTQYLATHHLPNWYDLLSQFTPLTRVYSEHDDLETELRALGWPAFFIKDYVKSLKTSIGSIISDPSSIPLVISEMRKFRGDIEGGVCVRQVEPFLADTERRYFVLNGNAYSSTPGLPIPPAVRVAAEKLSSPFFTVDIAQRADSALRIVELGDGQVSDLVGWPIAEFIRMWNAGAKVA